MAKIILVVKYTFFVGLVLGAGLVIERIAKIKRLKPASEQLIQDDLLYNGSFYPAYKNYDKILKKNYVMCLTNPSKPFCLLSSDKRLEIFQSDQEDIPNAEVIESRLQSINSDLEPRKLQMQSILMDYTKFMKKYDVKVFLIEPSMLFCVMSPGMQFKMLTSGFKSLRFQGSRNVVTVGVLGEDSKKLEQANLTSEILSAGYKVMKFRKWIGHETKRSFEMVHYFLVQKDVAVHVVVFFPQNTYLWHSSLDAEGVDLKDLLFVKEGIFENFILLPMNLEGSAISRMYLPHDIRYFLQDMESSRLVECRGISTSVIPLPKHAILTEEQLIVRAIIALKELKATLVPKIAFFWLWSKSLLGWFTSCDIFQYSTTLELAVTNKSIHGLNFTYLLADNEYLKVGNDTESDGDFQYKLTCHGLDISIFILHEDKDVLTYHRSEGQNETKLELSEFPVCSTHVYGQKVHLPCNPDKILKLEFEKEYADDISLNSTNKMKFSAQAGD